MGGMNGTRYSESSSPHSFPLQTKAKFFMPRPHFLDSVFAVPQFFLSALP